MSKYNVGSAKRIQISLVVKDLLVPGQVEDDASIRLGCRDIHTNLGLLRQTRRDNPDAFIIFKRTRLS